MLIVRGTKLAIKTYQFDKEYIADVITSLYTLIIPSLSNLYLQVYNLGVQSIVLRWSLDA